MTQVERAHSLVNRLNESQAETAVRFIEFLLADPVLRAIATAEPLEEALTPEEEAALAEAERGGACVSHEEVLADFGLKPSDFSNQK